MGSAGNWKEEEQTRSMHPPRAASRRSTLIKSPNDAVKC